jgi:hypothetical protein
MFFAIFEVHPKAEPFNDYLVLAKRLRQTQKLMASWTTSASRACGVPVWFFRSRHGRREVGRSMLPRAYISTLLRKKDEQRF